mmetsp:Transcript_52108/g.169265  ORF Transcript_52108/g.169265 Transcript_52108/m.169265 type:complete len:284 (-) Transcript_52108:1346-2197(-)
MTPRTQAWNQCRPRGWFPELLPKLARHSTARMRNGHQQSAAQTPRPSRPLLEQARLWTAVARQGRNHDAPQTSHHSWPPLGLKTTVRQGNSQTTRSAWPLRPLEANALQRAPSETLNMLSDVLWVASMVKPTQCSQGHLQSCPELRSRSAAGPASGHLLPLAQYKDADAAAAAPEASSRGRPQLPRPPELRARSAACPASGHLLLAGQQRAPEASIRGRRQLPRLPRASCKHSAAIAQPRAPPRTPTAKLSCQCGRRRPRRRALREASARPLPAHHQLRGALP